MAQEYRWLLPSALAGGAEGRPVRRSTRDWVVDTLMFLGACGLALLTYPLLRPDRPLLSAMDQVAGALACTAVWLRRRWPVPLAVATALLGAVLALVGGAAAVALFTVAVHRPFRVSGPVLALHLAAAVPNALLYPDPGLSAPAAIGFAALLSLMIFAWGMAVRARRRLVLSLRAQAEAAAREARRLERERIAREMHDVLAHRLSLLSVYAGALEFRPDAAPEDIAKAAGAIRGSAHQALQDLREVIGVLRDPAEEGPPGRPQPVLADLPALIEESRAAGMEVAFALRAGEVPETLGRNVYRIVQEALTNARKHAPGAPVDVTVTGAPGDGLTVEVRNPVPRRAGDAAPPGSGTGLIGLAERAALAGGRLEHRRDRDGRFLLRAWLPWPA